MTILRRRLELWSGSVSIEKKGLLANFCIGRGGMSPAVKRSTHLIKG
jgi:hypothetical protein